MKPPADGRRILPEFTYEQLEKLFAEWGEPSYRAKQVWEWVYKHLADDFQAMTNLPKALRQRLGGEFILSPLEPVEELVSEDGSTRKVLFRLQDGETIESVLMLYPKRRTVCISTQVGCPIGCAFCATGKSGFKRNLRAGEIIAQVLHFAREMKPQMGKDEKPITNVVVMGMGEPFLNYDATLHAIRTLNDHRGFNLGARRFTISTVGIVPGIRRLAKEGLQVELAVSLHAPNDELRDRLVPINKGYPLKRLMVACREYIEQTNRRITFEYVLIDRVNDSIRHARELAALIGGMLCHVNLIAMNPVPGVPYGPPPRRRVLAFEEELRRLGISVTLRAGRGVDIQAGCGQLRLRELSKRGAADVKA